MATVTALGRMALICQRTSRHRGLMCMANNHRPKTRNADDERPAIWVGYGKLVKLFRERAKLNPPQLAEQVGYSLEQVASIEQGRRPAKEAFTDAAERVLKAEGVLKHSRMKRTWPVCRGSSRTSRLWRRTR